MDSVEGRRSAIAAYINEMSSVTFGQIKEAFPDVSDMTIRTDLKALDEAKRIVRVHGGAKSVEMVIGNDDLLGKRAVQNVDAKQVIAEKAAGLVRENMTIFVDSGSTTTLLAAQFPDVRCLIITNSISCAVEFARLKKARVYVTGGQLNRNSLSLTGTSAVTELLQIHFDLAFLGATSYRSDTGFTCESLEDNVVKRMAVSRATEVVVLMDSSKVGKKGSFTMCDLVDASAIVSDDALPEKFLEECREASVKVY